MKRSEPGSLFAGARVAESVSLAPLTTLRVGPVASRVITCASSDQVITVLRQLDAQAERETAGPVLVFAGGSNLVIGDDLADLTVVRLANAGIAVEGVLHQLFHHGRGPFYHLAGCDRVCDLRREQVDRLAHCVSLARSS